MRHIATISDITLADPKRTSRAAHEACGRAVKVLNHETATDEQLMEAYVGGDDRAHRALFDRLAPVMVRVAARRLPSEDVARDVVQQAFLNMHRFRHDFQLGKRVRPWLTTIVMNLVREHHRRKGRRKEYLLDESETARIPAEIEHPTQSMQRNEMVKRAMGVLLDNQREVIEMHWFQDQSYEEISARVGASVAAVRVRAHRGYERMRAELATESC